MQAAWRPHSLPAAGLAILRLAGTAGPFVNPWQHPASGAAGMVANTSNPVDTGHYFRVSGVAANDVLNIRSAPDAETQILGMFAPDAGFIEVIEDSADGKWSRVNVGEGTGWVRRKFLMPVPVVTFYPTNIPVGLVCASTEPFISVQFNADMATLEQAGSPAEVFPYKTIEPRTNLDAFELQVQLGNNGPSFVLSETLSGNEANQLFPYSANSSGLGYSCSLRN